MDNTHTYTKPAPDGLSPDDKEWLNESLLIPDGNVNLNGNDGCKPKVNLESKDYKRRVILELKKCNYRTPPKRTAYLLEELFKNKDTKPGHWLYIAQNYTPRTINWVIELMIKLHRSGRETISIPAAYFTSLIQHRKKRKSSFRGTNGGRKPQAPPAVL
jgi:hypothetical protein